MGSTARSILVLLGSLLLGAVIFAACGGAVEDSATVEPEAASDSAESDAEGEVAEPREISFADHIQPILEANCVSCHSGTGPGTTHLVIETAGDVASIAEFAAFRVEDGQMPPWPQSGLQEISYQYDLSMSDEDRQLFVDWAEDGAALDVGEDAPLTSTQQAFPPIDADIVMTADEPYPGSDSLDDYRCRVLDPEFTDTNWVTSIETRPDETRVLHHSLVYKLPAALVEEANELRGADGLPGWLCQTVPAIGGNRLEQVAGWAPGTGPVTLPEGSGLLMESGDVFVVQWHYHYDGELLPDNSGIAVEVADAAELEANGGSLDPVRFPSLLGPVEIPCASYESGPLCDRDAALERVVQEFGFESSLIPAFVNQRCGVTPEDFAQFTEGVASSSCDVEVGRWLSGDVVSIWPHMHELGTTYRITLNPDTPDETVLVDIDRWDFNWQMGYYPDEPLAFGSGDVLRIECGWDRALWPADIESRYVVWAEGTQDEMCFTGLALR